MNHKTIAASTFAFTLLATFSHAALSQLSGLTGTTISESWSGMTATNHPGYGDFPGASPWPGTIASSVPNSAVLRRVSGGMGNGPIPTSGGIYFGGFSSGSNVRGGTLAVETTIPLADVQTVLFQIEIGEAVGYDFYDGVLPTLSYTVNGISTIVSATYSSNFAKVPNGTFTSPDGPQDLYLNSYALQYDLSGVEGTITDFSIQFSAVQHSVVYNLYLQQSDQALTSSILPVAVPEPASATLLGVGALILMRRRRA